MIKNILNGIILGIAVLFIVSCAVPSSSVSGNIPAPAYQVQNNAVYEVESTAVANSCKQIVFNYNSCDVSGNLIQLSGLILYPETTGTKKIKQIVLVEHGTIQKNDSAPSVSKNVDMSLVPTSDTENFTVIVSPDYIGYGKTKTKVHPYLNSELTAVNSLDMLLAAIKYFYDLNIQFSDSFNTMVTGYSQGGASTLAVHKYIDTYLSSENCEKIKFSKSVCGGSPSDIKATMDEYLAPGFTLKDEHIILVSYTIQSMLESYPELRAKYRFNDFFKTNFKNGKTAEDMLVNLNKKDNAGILNAVALFPDNKSAENVFSDAILNINSQLRKDVVECFNKNNVSSWSLKHPLYAFHATDDTVVPYANHEKLVSGMAQYSSLFHANSRASGASGNEHGGYCVNFFVGEVNNLRDIKVQ